MSRIHRYLVVETTNYLSSDFSVCGWGWVGLYKTINKMYINKNKNI